MKVMIRFLCLFAWFCASLHAQSYDGYDNGYGYDNNYQYDNCCNPCCNESPPWDNGCDCCCKNYTIEARIGGFNPFSKRLREIDNSVWINYELEIARTWCNCWKTWFNVGYTTCDGHSDPLGDDSRVHLIPLSLGLNYMIPLCDCFQAYVGAGVSYTFFRNTNTSAFVPNHLNREAWGGVIKSGVIYQLCQCLYLNGFVDYSYTPFNFSDFDPAGPNFVERDDLEAGGIRFGIGLGMNF